jgi:hypothetical protein
VSTSPAPGRGARSSRARSRSPRMLATPGLAERRFGLFYRRTMLGATTTWPAVRWRGSLSINWEPAKWRQTTCYFVNHQRAQTANALSLSSYYHIILIVSLSLLRSVPSSSPCVHSARFSSDSFWPRNGTDWLDCDRIQNGFHRRMDEEC